MTWIFFLLVVGGAFWLFQLSWRLLLTFFLFPVVVQYGTGFFGEMYTSLFLLIIMASLLGAEKTTGAKKLALVGLAGLFSFLVGIHVQSFVLLPLSWGAIYFLNAKRRWQGVFLILCGVTAILAFLKGPQTVYQIGYPYWTLQTWLNLGLKAPFHYALLSLELFLAVGIFLLPALNLKRLRLQEAIVILLVQVLFVAFYRWTGFHVLSAGVFFVTQISTLIALAFLSFGFWGWWAVWQAWKNGDRQKILDGALPLAGTALGLAGMIAFSAYRWALDIRYFVPCLIPILFYLSKWLKSREKEALGSRVVVFAGYFVFAVLLNAYSLKTTEKRWEVAEGYHTAGVPREEISAGAGYNAFFIERECVDKIVRHLEQTETAPYWKAQVYFDRILNMYYKSHTIEWIPRYVIKPAKLLGIPISPKTNPLPGQEKSPVGTVSYRVYGLPNELAVFENPAPVQAWCFRMPASPDSAD